MEHAFCRKFPLIIAVAGISALSSCSLEPQIIPAEELFVRDFISNYGLPDASHSWSMAEAVDAKIEIKGVETGTLMVISGNMGSGDARLLARLPIRNGKVAARMPLQAGTSGVTLRVIDATNSVRGDFPVAVSQLTETNTVLRVASAPSDEYLPTAVRDIEKQTFTIEDFTMEQYEQYLETYPGGSYPDFETWASTESLSNLRVNINPETHTIPNLKYIDNLYYEMGPALSFKNELAPAFLYYYNPETGEKTDGVFKEGENNLQKYYHDAEGGVRFDPNVTFWVYEEGPVTMQCTWRGTQYKDYFGYFYFNPEDYDDEKGIDALELWNNVPKYIFLDGDDVCKTSNLTQIKSENSGYADDESGWTDMDGMACAGFQYQNWQVTDPDKYIRGRKYYLAYFGKDYNQPASYNFPANVRIGYFLYVDGGESAGKIYFSDCKSQYEICRNRYWKGGGVEGPEMRPFAAKFRMMNRTFVGFGDESGDCDLNDIVFIAENVYPTPNDITPPEFKEEDPAPTVTPNTWTVACEDLGATDDIDFNDVVLDVAYVAGESTITITPRAAGGTLQTDIYFREGNNTEYTHLGEIHGMMSPEFGSPIGGVYAMLNTQSAGYHVNPALVKGITVTVPDDFDFTDEDNGFMSRLRVTTRQADDALSDAKIINAYTDLSENGRIPQMLLLPADWHWPVERTDISVAYTKFKAWVKDKDVTDWINSGQDGFTLCYRTKCGH